MSDKESVAGFRFDRVLWRRFLSVFRLYLYPEARHAGRHLLGLLCAAFAFVVMVSVWLFAAIKATTAAFSISFFQLYIQPVLRGFFIFDFHFTLISSTIMCALMLLILWYAWSQRKVLHGRWRRWLMVVAILFLLLCVTEANIVLVNTFRLITNSLVDFQAQSNSLVGTVATFKPHRPSQASFWNSLTVYGGLLLIVLPVLIGFFYIRLKYIRYWRGWLTRHFMQHYYHDRAYYHLNSNDPKAVEKGIDNPDQRMSEDLRNYTEATLGFILDFFSATLDLIGFTGLLWFHSPKLAVMLVIYAVVATVIAALISRRLISIEYNQLKFEANFRFGLIHTRNHAETIAFYKGEQQEQSKNDSLFERVLKNFDKKIIWLSIIGFYQRSYAFFSRIFPYFFVIPDFFNGTIKTFGDIELILFSFTTVQTALSTITFAMEKIAQSAASINRLGLFYDALSTPSSLVSSTSQVELSVGYSGFEFQHLHYSTPNGEQELLRDLNLDLGKDRLMIVGASGLGKSSLLRVIAGLWRTGSGQIVAPSQEQMFFVPQRPYMVLGTLREQCLFPYMDQSVADSDLVNLITQFGLDSALSAAGGLDSAMDWGKVLSLGEQQRISIIRILLHCPPHLLLDEVTSALDQENELKVFTALSALPSQYIAVCHNHRLACFFDRVLVFESDGASRVLSAESFLRGLDDDVLGGAEPA